MVNLPGVILLFKIRNAGGERKYLVTASNLTELTLTVNKSSKLYYSIVCLDFLPWGGVFFDTFD